MKYYNLIISVHYHRFSLVLCVIKQMLSSKLMPPPYPQPLKPLKPLKPLNIYAWLQRIKVINDSSLYFPI